MRKFKLLFVVLFTAFMMMPFHVFAFQLSVESEGQDPVSIEVEESDTISAVKSKVEEALNIENRRQVLSYNGNKLEEGRTLGDYEIPRTNGKIQVTLKEELNIFYVTFDNPVSGNKPDFLGDIVISNKDGSKKVEFKDLKLEWSKLSVDMSDTTLLNDNDVFEDGSKYLVNTSSETTVFINEELDKKDCVFSEEGEVFYNGKAFTLSSYFYIGGVKTINEEPDRLIIGKDFPKKIKYTFVTDKETKEFVLDIDEWIELDENGNKVKSATGVVEAGKSYLPSVDETNLPEFNKYMLMVDMRTEVTWNGTTESNYVGVNVYKVVFDANGGSFENDVETIDIEDIINFNYETFEKPNRKGYRFIGFYTKDGKSYYEVMNSEAGIEEDTTFYAKWELEEEVPKTLDNITKSILMGMISLVGLVGATIYLKRKIN